MCGAATAITIVVLAIAVCAGASQRNSPGADQQLEARKYEAAITYYEKLLNATGAKPADLIQARADLATSYFMLHRYAESLKALQPLLTLTQTSGVKIPARAWTLRGLDYLELNQVSLAIESLRKALEIDPNAGTARLGLGDAYARSGRMAEAAQEYEAQAQRTPALAEPWYKLGLVHAKLASELPQNYSEEFRTSIVGEQLAAEEQLAGGNNLEAARALFHLLHQAPNQPEIHAELGTALLALGYSKSAESQFRQELAHDPNSPLAALGIAQINALTGDWVKALTQVERLAHSERGELMRLLDFPSAGPLRQAWIDHRLRLPDALTARPMGLVWSAWLGNTGNAASLIKANTGTPEACDSSINITTAQTGAWLSESCYRLRVNQLRAMRQPAIGQRVQLAEAEFRLGKHDAALRDAEQILKADPRNAWGMYWLSKAHAAVAEDCFLQVGVLNPESPRVHEMLAQHYLGWSDYPRAKAEYRAALRMAPDFPDLHLGLGSVYWKAGELPQAETEFVKTLELVPESAAAHYELGDVYVQEHQWRCAIQHLQHAADSAFKKEARIDLAKAEDQLGQTQQAIHDLLPVEKEDVDGQIHFLLAGFYRKTRDTAEAEAALADFKRLRAASLEQNENEFDALDHDNQNNESSSHRSSH